MDGTGGFYAVLGFYVGMTLGRVESGLASPKPNPDWVLHSDTQPNPNPDPNPDNGKKPLEKTLNALTVTRMAWEKYSNSLRNLAATP